MPPPTRDGDVRRFSPLVNQEAKYVSSLEEMTEPFKALLENDRYSTRVVQQQESFEIIKREVTQQPVLALYDPDRETILSVDASSFGLGAVLRQKQPDGDFKAVAYASRSLSETERRYAQIEK